MRPLYVVFLTKNEGKKHALLVIYIRKSSRFSQNSIENSIILLSISATFLQYYHQAMIMVQFLASYC